MKQLTSNIQLLEETDFDQLSDSAKRKVLNEGIVTLKEGRIYKVLGVAKVTASGNITEDWYGIAIQTHGTADELKALSPKAKEPMVISYNQLLGLGFQKNDEGKFIPVRTSKPAVFDSAVDCNTYKGKIKVVGSELLSITPFGKDELSAKTYYHFERVK